MGGLGCVRSPSGYFVVDRSVAEPVGLHVRFDGGQRTEASEVGLIAKCKAQ